MAMGSPWLGRCLQGVIPPAVHGDVSRLRGMASLANEDISATSRKHGNDRDCTFVLHVHFALLHDGPELHLPVRIAGDDGRERHHVHHGFRSASCVDGGRRLKPSVRRTRGRWQKRSEDIWDSVKLSSREACKNRRTLEKSA